MKRNIPKSILAVLAGLLFNVVLSITTDTVLTKTGIMKQPFVYNGSGFILLVIFYRTIYGVVGSYITASLAPNQPMMHVMIPGVIGFLASIAGLIVMWDVPPHWYPIALVLLALPTAWFGGWLKVRKIKT